MVVGANVPGTAVIGVDVSGALVVGGLAVVPEPDPEPAAGTVPDPVVLCPWAMEAKDRNERLTTRASIFLVRPSGVVDVIPKRI